jgi:transposase-like protein
MSKDSDNPFKWQHFQGKIILLTIWWYLRYALSYRDLEEMMLERGLTAEHTTIFRWVQAYAPELDKRCRPYLKKTNDSWRVDETYNLRYSPPSSFLSNTRFV